MTDSNKSAAVSATQARKTALVVATVLLAIAAWSLYRQRQVMVAVFAGLAFSLTVIGFALPALAMRFHILWMKLAYALGYVNSRILLGLMFYGIFTPYGLISRLVGRDPLRRRAGKGDSYWIDRKTSRQTREQFERLF